MRKLLRVAPLNLFVAALAIGLPACNGEFDFGDDGPTTSAVVQQIATQDALGTNASQFFPIGIFVDGSCQIAPVNGGLAARLGAAPQDPVDSAKYYDETMRHLASLGFTAVVDPMASDWDGHGPRLITSAQNAGLYVFHASQSMTYTTGLTCTSLAPPADDLMPSDQDVSNHITAGMHSCYGGPNAGVACTDDGNCSTGKCFNYATNTAVAAFALRDEPREMNLPRLRLESKWLQMLDPSHTGFSSTSTTLTCQGTLNFCDTDADCGTGGHCIDSLRSVLIDKMLGYDTVAYDGVYPLLIHTSIGNVTALENWNASIDQHYILAPSDKPFYQIIQAHQAEAGARVPTPAEVRYMTYSALARGIKGIFYYIYTKEHNQESGIADYDFNINPTGHEVQTLAAEMRKLAPWLVDATRDMPQKNGYTTAAYATGQTANDYDISSFHTKSNENLVMLVNEHIASSYCSASTWIPCNSNNGGNTPCPSGETCVAGDAATRTFNVTVDYQAQMPAVYQKVAAVGGSVQMLDLRASLTHSTTVGSDSTGATLNFTDTLNAGDGKLYLVMGPDSAEIRVPKDAYTNPVTNGSSGKPILINVQLTNNGTNSWVPGTHHVGVHVYPPGGGKIDAAAGLSGGEFAATVAPGATVTLQLSVPTNSTSSLTQTGEYKLGIDAYQDTANGPVWFQNEQQIEVTVLGPTSTALLVDTFDSVPYNRPADFLWKWEHGRDLNGNPTAGWNMMTVRADMLAINGQGSHYSNWGSSWTDYTFEFDVMIDPEAPPQDAYAGWIFRASDTTNSGYLFELGASDASSGHASHINKNTCQSESCGVTPDIDTGLTIQRGVWYHIKEVLTGSTIQTYVNGTLRDTWTNSANTTGRVGFWELEPAYIGCGSPAEAVGTCVGGTSPGAPCMSAYHCTGTGATCSGVTDNCYRGLMRAHFDNVSVYTSGAPPTPIQVTGLAVTGKANYLTLSWSHAQDSTSGGASVGSYRVYRGTVSTFVPGPSNQIGEIAGTSFNDTSATSGQSCYAIKAVNSANVEGVASSVVCRTPSALPSTVSVTPTVNTLKWVHLAWSSNGADHYDVYRGLTGFTPSASTKLASVVCSGACVYDDAPTNTFVSDTQLGLNAFKSYDYYVIPVSASGGSAVGNAAITITPPGSSLFSDNFDSSSTSANYSTQLGSWSYVGTPPSTYYRNGSSSNASVATIANKKMANLVVEFTLQIESDPSDPSGLNWAGMTIRKNNQTDRFTGTYSGYLVFYRNNGNIELYDPVAGASVATANTNLSPSAAPRRVRIEAMGSHYKIFVDGTKYIDWSDPNFMSRPTAGYFDFTTWGGVARYYDVNTMMRDGFTSLEDGILLELYSDRSYQTAYAGTWCDPRDGTCGWPQDVGPGDVAGGVYLQTRTDVVGMSAIKARTWADVEIGLNLGIESNGGNTSNWAGVTIRKQAESHQFASGAYSGYLVFVRSSGQVVLWDPIDGPVSCSNADGTQQRSENNQTADGAVDPNIYQYLDPTTGTYKWKPGVGLDVVAVGYNIKVYDGARNLLIDCTDANQRYAQGYVDLTTEDVNARFLYMSVSEVQNGPVMGGWSFVGAGNFDAHVGPNKDQSGQLQLDAPAGVGYTISPNELHSCDLSADLALRLDSVTVSTDWAAFAFRKTNQGDSGFTSGYFVYWTGDGHLSLWSAGHGNIGPTATVTSALNGYQHIRLIAKSNHIQVFGNGQLLIDVLDSSWPVTGSGCWTHLASSQSTARFEFLQVY